MDISAIDTLEAIVDGDTLVPGMSFVLPAGVGKTQFYDPSTKVCTPDYSSPANRIILYPSCYSSLNGKFVIPSASDAMWYLDDPDSASAQILTEKGGAVAGKYANLFEKTTYTVNNQTYPALKIIGNLAGEDSLNDVVIYFKSTFNGMEITCHGHISIKESVGSLFDILINSVNEDGVNDTVIDNDSEYLQLTASLQDSGVNVSATGAWSWMKSTAAGLVAVAHVAGVSELSNSNRTLKLYEGAIEGTEEYFAAVIHNGVTYRKGIQVSDTHDPYYINIGRSQAGNLVKIGENVTYTPSVLARSSRVIQSGWTYAFTLRDNAGNTVRTAAGVSTFQVTGAEVHEKGGLNTHIVASKS
jgi:hypothetical protein